LNLFHSGNSLTKPSLLNIILGVEFGVMDMLQLDVARLKRSPGDSESYELAADMPPLNFSGEDITFAGPVKASIIVGNKDKFITVEGKVSGELILHCSRCLTPFHYNFEAAIDEKYVSLQEAGETDLPTYAGDFIDITPEVINSICLALPMKAICSDDCAGLCPECGCNLNESSCQCNLEDNDLRLSILKGLLEKNDK
jgi:uncharacterized protein